MIGAAAIGLEPRYQGAVLMVGGGTLLEFFDRRARGFGLHQFPGELFTTVAADCGGSAGSDELCGALFGSAGLVDAGDGRRNDARESDRSFGPAMHLPQVAPIYARIDDVDERRARR